MLLGVRAEAAGGQRVRGVERPRLRAARPDVGAGRARSPAAVRIPGLGRAAGHTPGSHRAPLRLLHARGEPGAVRRGQHGADGHAGGRHRARLGRSAAWDRVLPDDGQVHGAWRGATRGHRARARWRRTHPRGYGRPGTPGRVERGGGRGPRGPGAARGEHHVLHGYSPGGRHDGRTDAHRRGPDYRRHDRRDEPRRAGGASGAGRPAAVAAGRTVRRLGLGCRRSAARRRGQAGAPHRLGREPDGARRPHQCGRDRAVRDGRAGPARRLLGRRGREGLRGPLPRLRGLRHLHGNRR